MEKTIIRKINRDDSISKISISGVDDTPGKAFEIFSELSKNGICVDIILQVPGNGNGKDITFTILQESVGAVTEILNRLFGGAKKIDVMNNVSKVSVIGSGMINQPGIAASIFEIMDNLDIDIQMVSTSEMSISLIIDENEAARAVNELKDKFNI